MKIRAFVPGMLSTAVIASLSSSAAALPQPMTEQELLDNSELVVEGHATTALCDGEPVEDLQKVTSTYRTFVEVTHTLKGTAPQKLEVRGYHEEYKEAAMCAAALPALPRGFRGVLHLVAEADGTFSATHWNAFDEDETTSAPETLPDCAAQPDPGPADPDPNDAEPSASDDGGCTVASGTPASNAAFAAFGIAIAAAVARRRRR